ncbi:MAG TPA: dTDP-4-dehydrorhamnose reductase [Phenylobacterium sp.]|uniref:dTDP-4-dehydrorhamnose reductase n=1 Tax=Phenylobacterium sp. TaxID=1871053 RepID=UPI002C3834D5|nr:dTDP-4-dehydrorhamnose reductase [Phenylobacterium sp.]HSV03699.1 dTDP-4-dehydrorhamnose reductase [Phenylobacterium sp.]
MSLRILQFGATGQVASEMLRQAADRPVELMALTRRECDLAEPAACAEVVRDARPDLVLIAAAYTAVDRAEAEPELANRINGEAPGAIARAAHAIGAPVVHLSTDYVFDGTKGTPYTEADPVRPANAYGASKALGDQAVLEGASRALILRTSWVVSAHGKNFVKTMLRLAAEGRPLRVVDDQSGRPTSAADLAGFILANAAALAAAPTGDPRFGLCNFANAGETTWRGLAEAAVAEALGDAAPAVTPIATAEFPTPARRPARGALDTHRLETLFGYSPRPWREALRDIVAELKVAA